MSSLTELGRHLSMLTETMAEAGARIAESQWRESYGPGKWTRLEVLGHLVDSAAHNHQRFARALHSESITMAGYDGASQVRVQRYAEAPVATLLDAWRAYNRLIGFVIAQIPADRESVPCSIGPFPPMSLRDLANDYVAHLEHHARTIFEGRDTFRYSGLPWPPADRWRKDQE
jgi:hypothetical protein